MRILFSNAHVYGPGDPFSGWLLVEDQFISDMGPGKAPQEIAVQVDRIEDLKGKWLLPGVIDTHVHFREPGLTHKADMASESRAAVAGGVTSVIDMPNTVPQTTAIDVWEEKMNLAEEKCVVNYAFFIGATNDNYRQLTNLDPTRVPGVKVFLGSSTGSMLVNDNDALDAIFSLPYLIAVHCEDEAVISSNREILKASYGMEIPVSMHGRIRSADACFVATQAAVRRAMRLDTRLHVLHVSTANELDLFSPGPYSGKRITAETCVQYLWFTEDDYNSLGSRIKCNPAIKSVTDRDALRRALFDGRIDTIATDHAPHLLEEKNGGALRAASGIPMIQYSLPAMLTLAKETGIPVSRIVELMSGNPAGVYSIDRRGALCKGYFADMVVIDPDHTTMASDGNVISKCGWTPFHQREFPVAVEATYVNGKCVYKNGVVTPQKGAPLRFNTVS